MNRLSDVEKLDIALTPANLNGAGTGAYFRMDLHRKAVFAVQLGAMAAAVTSAAQVLQAQDAAGTGSVALAGALATVTANTRVAAALLASGAVHVAGNIYTVNGLVFTAAAADVPGTRTYAIGANATASTLALANKINDPVIGVPGVLAAAAVGDLTLTLREPGDNTITLAASAGAVGVPSTLRAVAFVEVDAAALTSNTGFSHVALQVTNSAAVQTSAILVRGDSRYLITQDVAASAVL